ncbi:MAG: prepilin-type N-terminal cleavage/methylation domain-containing protein [Planctomycetota bacterium]|nr:prepilin-type N-terminal cleavage/methylation domain-containing protein [Planctomycetota bacterium]
MIRSRPAKEAGFTFLEVLMAMTILASFSVLIIGLFAIGVDRMVDRRVEARFQQVRPEIDAILQAHLDQSRAGDLPPAIPHTEAIPLSRRGYSLAATFKVSPFQGAPGFVAVVELLFQGQPVKRELLPLRQSYVDLKQVTDGK